ncbi:MAG: flagellar basal body-associated FliL family protein [Gammaproteobacteria bacterium]|nr:flagellar basal body-associated FliL family protein [Gammaproteobacteria bacterium]
MPPEDLNLDEEGKAGKGKFIIMIVGALLLIGASVGGTLYFSGALDKKDEVEEKVLAEINPTFYIDLEPEFVVNFAGDQEASYMQVGVQLMTRDQHFVDEAMKQMPVIRHQILLILSNQKFAELKTKEGKDKLRTEILNKLQEMIPGNPKVPGIEAVYFTMFVMQ